MEAANNTDSEIRNIPYFQLASIKASMLVPELQELHELAGIFVPEREAGFLEPAVFRTGYTPCLMDEADMVEVEPVIAGFIYLLDNIQNSSLKNPERLRLGNCYMAEHAGGGGWQAVIQPIPQPQLFNLYEADLPDPSEYSIHIDTQPWNLEFFLHAKLLPVPLEKEDGTGFYPMALVFIAVGVWKIVGMQLLEATIWKERAVPGCMELLMGLKRMPAALHYADERIFPIADFCGRMLDIPVKLNQNAGEELQKINELLIPGPDQMKGFSQL